MLLLTRPNQTRLNTQLESALLIFQLEFVGRCSRVEVLAWQKHKYHEFIFDTVSTDTALQYYHISADKSQRRRRVQRCCYSHSVIIWHSDTCCCTVYYNNAPLSNANNYKLIKSHVVVGSLTLVVGFTLTRCCPLFVSKTTQLCCKWNCTVIRSLC